jgi:branched-chain amino acid aminotransferase
MERTLAPADLERADQVFITSTTRDLMPVSHIEGLQVRSQGLAMVAQLEKAFAEYRDSYVKRNAASLDGITA